MVKINFIAVPFGYLIEAIYNFCNNYGLAIILFTVIIKIILFPLGMNQYKTSALLAKIQPEINQINKKYKNDKEKLSKETMALYQKHNINPMSGCLPLLLQFPIIIALYQVIQRPLTYILHYSAEEVTNLQNIFAQANNLDPKRVTEIAVAGKDALINFNLFGLDISKTPQISEFSALWIIPILATLVTFLTSYVTKKLSGNPEGNEQAASMTSSMNLMMPIMTLMITFTLPAGIGLYWFISSLVSVIQQIWMTKYYQKKFQTESAKEKKA